MSEALQHACTKYSPVLDLIKEGLLLLNRLLCDGGEREHLQLLKSQKDLSTREKPTLLYLVGADLSRLLFI